MARPTPSDVRSPRRRAPALTPEDRQDQLTAMAMDEAEKRILSGTASSQLLTVFIKAGLEKDKLEIEKLRSENELLRAKTDAIKSAKKVETLYAEALKAMRTYSGQGSGEEEADEY